MVLIRFGEARDERWSYPTPTHFKDWKAEHKKDSSRSPKPPQADRVLAFGKFSI